MCDLRGKRAWVCGSTQGIGKACAMELADWGATVTLLARDAEALERVCGELSTDADQTHDFVCADFHRPDALSERARAHLSATGSAQVLVNNTGGPKSGPIVDAEPDAFRVAFTNHVVCNHLLMQAVLPGMKASGYGRIINIISSSVFLPIRGLGVSNTTRAAVANWAKTVASEVGQFGVTVNNVLPGYTDTARLKSLIKVKAERDGVSEKDVVDGWVASIPMGRLGDPREIAAVVGFLSSPAASYVSGVNVPVDGGRLASQ